MTYRSSEHMSGWTFISFCTCACWQVGHGEICQGTPDPTVPARQPGLARLIPEGPMCRACFSRQMHRQGRA